MNTIQVVAITDGSGIGCQCCDGEPEYRLVGVPDFPGSPMSMDIELCRSHAVRLRDALVMAVIPTLEDG